jgi:hypothetical protein
MRPAVGTISGCRWPYPDQGRGLIGLCINQVDRLFFVALIESTEDNLTFIGFQKTNKSFFSRRKKTVFL